MSASAISGGNPPAPDYSRTLIRQKITETYDSCDPDDSERTIYHTLWTVYAGGATGAWSLPAPPAGWPRASYAAPYQGLIDPSSTAEDDVVDWLHMTAHEGLNASFSYDAIAFDSLALSVTHAVINSQEF